MTLKYLFKKNHSKILLTDIFDAHEVVHDDLYSEIKFLVELS